MPHSNAHVRKGLV